jgi:hypothetical protein
MKLRSRCGTGYPDNASTCPIHGGLLSKTRGGRGSRRVWYGHFGLVWSVTGGDADEFCQA